MKNFLLFLIGGSLYYIIEILFRGYSHWTMLIVGGLIFLYADYRNQLCGPEASLFQQALWVWTVTLLLEFTVGCFLNLGLGWNIWDYSDMPLNLFGQICLPFALMFFPLCTAAVLLDNFLRHWLFHEKKIFYKM